MNWHRWIDVATRPRWLLAAALVAVLAIGAGAVIVQSSDDAPTEGPPGDSTPTLQANGNGSGSADAVGALLSGRSLSSLSEAYEDTDNDGLPNLLENYVYGSDPQDAFTSGGTIPDGWLAKHGYDPTEPGVGQRWAAYPGADQAPDAFGPDGLPPAHRMTLEETYAWNRSADWNVSEDGVWDNGLDPRRIDQGAGLAFSWLIEHELDPFDAAVGERVLDPAPEGDGLTVNESYQTATDPRESDTDGDGLADDVELEQTNTDPARFSTTGRGVADGWAVEHGLDPLAASMAFEDPDTDGLSNREEFDASVQLVGLNATLDGDGLDPRDAFSGGASIPDGWLVEMDLDPLEPGIGERVLQRSTDHGPAAARGVDAVVLTVHDAYAYDKPQNWTEAVDGPWMGGLSAKTNDTDGDGLPDAVEIAGWTVNVTVGTGPGQSSQDRNATSNPKRADTDGDGLTDHAEFRGRTQLGESTSTSTFEPTDPTSRDTDFDGLSDHTEVVEIPRRASEAGIEGQTLEPTVQDTDADGLPDGPEFDAWTNRAARYRAGSTAYGFDNRETDGVTVLGGMPGARGPGGVATQTSVARALEPWGDVDDDDQINVLDQDADGDELHDGWEIDPSTYAQSPFASEHERPATDPANADTDGDELPDGWEIRFGDWDISRNTWNLDPSTWDSLGDGTPDGERDLDDDGTTWYTFTFTGAGYEREEHTFEATNLVEYEHGTDPNEASTASNGLVDGWTIFWGEVYPNKDASEVGDVYPGAPGPLVVPADAPKPSPTQDVDAVTDTADRLRFSTENDPTGDEVLENVYSGVEDASSGEVKDVHRFRERVRYTFQHEQDEATNPYLRDTDADSAPDAWEFAYAAGGPTPDPLAFERDDDEDGDGLTLQEEVRARTDPTTGDTDLGGVPDGEEANPDAPTDPLDPRDDVRLRDASVDTDGDGIPDIDEVQGWTHPSLGEIRTDPTTPDTDGDALLDGDHIELDPEADQATIETFQALGIAHVTLSDGTLRFLGEVGWGGDPRAMSTPEDGVPDGWRAHWDLSPDAAELDPTPFYTHAKPPWWDAARMGPWWWGLAPAFDADVDGDGLHDVERVGNDFRLEDPDLDQDGLSDVNGEDPTPAARAEPAPPAGLPNAPGLTSTEVRERAAAFGVPVEQRNASADRDSDADGVPDAHDQVQAHLTDLTIHADTRDGTLQLKAATDYTATGRVTVDAASGDTVPVPNATVAVHAGGPGRALGYAPTRSDGTFEVPFSVQPNHEQANAPPGIAFRGQTQAPITWQVNLSDLSLGPGGQDDPNQLRVQVYNTSGATQPDDPTHLGVTAKLDTPDGGTTQAPASGIQGTVSDPIDFTFVADSHLKLDAPGNLTVSTPLNVSLTLEDGTGDPVPNASITLNAAGTPRKVTTDTDGHATATFPSVTDAPGALTVNATYDGAQHRLPATNQTTATVRYAATLDITGATPLPAAAGQPLDVSGHLDAPIAIDGQPVQLRVPGAVSNTTTDANGRYTATFTLPEDLPAGETTLVARFPGTDTLAPASTETPVPVRAKPHIGLAVPGGEDTLRPNAETQLVVSVTVGNQTPLPGQVTVRGLPGEPQAKNVTIGEDGTGGIAWTTGETLGAHRVIATRPADDGHVDATNQTWLTVTAPSRVTAHPTTLFRGHAVTLTGTLEDVFGTPIDGGRVDVAIQGTPVATARADANGTFHATWTVDRERPLGPADVTLTYTPGEGDPWDGTTRTLTLPVKSAVVAELTSQHVLRSDPTATVELATDTGEPVRSGTAELIVPELDLTATTSVEGGQATFNLPLDRDAPPGRYPATIALHDVPDLETPPIPLNLTVATPVDVTLETPDGVGRGSSLPVHARATSDTGAPVTGGTLTASLAGARPVNASLTANGTALHVPVPEETPTGPTPLTVAWTGPAGFLDAEIERTVNVLKATQLTVELPETAEPGERVEGTIHLTTADGTPLPDRRVLVRDEATNQSVLVTTDDDGQAPITFQSPSLEPTRLSVRFPGDDAQAGAASTHTVQTATPALQRGPGLALVALGLAAFAVIAALGVWGYRRRQLQAEVADALDEGARRVLAENEHRAVVLMTYFHLVDILEAHDVVPQDTQTLREYQTDIQRSLGVTSRHLEALFDVFDEVLYSHWPTTREEARRAHTAFTRLANDLRERLEEAPASPGPEEDTEEVSRLA